MSDAQDEKAPFERDGLVNKPGLIGARWWQQGLAASPDPVTRRSAMGTVLMVGAALGGIGLVLALAAKSDDDDGGDSGPAPSQVAKPLIEMQKTFGWNFGARSVALTFDGISTAPFDAGAIDRMADDLAPGNSKHLPFWSPTLFQSPSALPTNTAEADGAETFQPLKTVLKPINTPAMNEQFARGRALARLLANNEDVAVVVDLQGPEAVAFAAGMAGFFDPVFTFENWPHPRGVVPAHRTLAAALYYQPLFSRRRESSKARPPVFVLDNDRLAKYADETQQFDNRWIAKLPSAASLAAIGVKRVLYVTYSDYTSQEMDDVNDDVVAWSQAKLDVRMIGALAFKAGTGDGFAFKDETTPPPAYFYGGSADADPQFWVDYPWWVGKEPPPKPKAPATIGPHARDWRPKPRVSSHSTGSAAPAQKPRPPNFGTVPVMVAVGTAAVLGWRHHRNGSWNRAPVSGGGTGFG